MELRQRMVGVFSVLVSALAISGGSLVATATPSSAAAGGTNVCASLTETATIDPVTFAITEVGTFSGCEQQRSGTFVAVVGPNQDPAAPGPITIRWATGHAASEGIASTVPRALVDTRCPAGTNATIDVSLAIVHGPYTGSTGHLEECIDFSGLSDGIVRGVSVGPVVI